MTRTLAAPIVGAYHRPPAKTILQFLPGGAQITLVKEPENPYDPSAIKVFVDPTQVPESQLSELTNALPLQGYTIEQIMSGGPIQLGYIAASGGKPLAKAKEANGGVELVGNQEIGEWALETDEAQLGFAPDGLPLVLFTLPLEPPEAA